MQVKVLFFGVLQDILGRAEDELSVAPGTTLGDIFDLYAARAETLRHRQSSILLARNHEFALPATEVFDQDEIAFLPPVSGGSTPSSPVMVRHHYALTRDVIDSQALSRRLQRPEDGASVLFEGVVRNNSAGRNTAYLDYQCYVPMAQRQMEQIGQELTSQYQLGGLGIIHRLGRLEVGEVSVAIVATAPHRKAAFEAALECINRLKREVPIWKRETYVDGAVWIDGEWDDNLLSTVPAPPL